MTSERRTITTLTYWANHHDDPDAWKRMARDAGYSVERSDRGYDLYLGDDHMACMFWGQTSREWFAFVFMPEAGAPWLSKAWWRLTHPFAPLRELPWPRKATA